jgi:hypothetical protein
MYIVPSESIPSSHNFFLKSHHVKELKTDFLHLVYLVMLYVAANYCILNEVTRPKDLLIANRLSRQRVPSQSRQDNKFATQNLARVKATVKHDKRLGL